ncbi:hypothetical protein CXB51_028292 [Gossypium anomalum]|uniref:Endonuclease/exonuclease/phosphatase domain-containing protein n=1 Tax=Gossypium anomalum TaxID=47600 RepID=A0A8J6CQ91_9ROSI|nr:hypothetical protein CXB51_028292 [Gossypium anomalum]
MKILSWNVRGLGSPRTVKRLKNKLRAVNPRILFLMETKLSAKRMEMVRLKCGFENGIEIGAIETKGRLFFGWKENSLVRLKSFSYFHIDVELSHDQNVPWVILGYFNEITNSFEKQGGRLRSDRQMDDFRMTLEDCSLHDLGFVAKWCLESSFEEVIKRWWADSSGSVPWKLEKLGHQLQQWSRSKIREEKENRVVLEERLNCLYSQEPSDEILAEITNVKLNLNLEADKKELFWEQRAHVNLLKNGDRNTSYFHKVAVQCQFRGRISELEDESSRSFSSTEEMLRLASEYFINLFSASDMGSDEHLFRLVEKRVTDV